MKASELIDCLQELDKDTEVLIPASLVRDGSTPVASLIGIRGFNLTWLVTKEEYEI